MRKKKQMDELKELKQKPTISVMPEKEFDIEKKDESTNDSNSEKNNEQQIKNEDNKDEIKNVKENKKGV